MTFKRSCRGFLGDQLWIIRTSRWPYFVIVILTLIYDTTRHGSIVPYSTTAGSTMNVNSMNRQAGSSTQRTSDPQVWPNMYLPNSQQLPSQGVEQSRVAQPYTNQTNTSSGWGSGPSGSYPNPISIQPSNPHNNTTSAQANDSVLGFMQTMPTKNEDSSQHALWTELVRMKTRTLELQIAQARAKEREAEAELLKLRQMYSQKGGVEDLSNTTGSTGQDVFGSLPMSASGSGQYGQGAGVD